MKKILTINETVARAQEMGLQISGYSLRRAIKSGAVPCRVVGRKFLIPWKSFERWIMCVDGGDNAPVGSTTGIRRIEVGGIDA